ncbi:MAG: Hpt domain-containing protein, partial [Aureliella sp.]
DSPELLMVLDEAIAAGDCRAARHAAHSLKGQVATFFAGPVVELAQRLEHEAADNRLTEFVDGGCSQLRQAIARLEQELCDRGLVR